MTNSQLYQDIHSLWLSAVPKNISLCMIRLNEYFPFLNPQYVDTSPRSFIHYLDQQQEDTLREVGMDCHAFVNQTYAWANENRREGYVSSYTIRPAEPIHYSQHICEVLYSPECRQTFPPIKEDVLRGLTEGYLSIIEKLVKDLERTFPLRE